MGFDTNDAINHALCMDLSKDVFQYAVFHLPSKKIVFHEAHELTDFTRDEVDKLMKSPLFKADFTHFILSTGGERNTLLPVDIFAYTNPKDTFKLNFAEPHENLDYNRIPELGIVNIYELPLWIKSQFVIKIPRIKIVHRATALLKGVFDQDTFYPKVHAWVDKSQFYLMITDQNKLAFFNRFDYAEVADFIYHVLFVLDQKEIDQKKLSMQVYGVDDSWVEQHDLKQFFTFPVKVDEQRELGKDFLLGKQFLCV